MPAYTFVDQPASITPSIDVHPRIGVDTEFMRERTFFAQLALVQIATAEQIFCVDPLSGADMAEFWARLRERTWVLHSARQDIEVVYQSSGRMPESIFDTQVAAALLGYQPQMGYGNLVTELFGVQLDKSHTRADWTRRPLSDAILAYAAEDVEYLLPAHETLAERLQQKGRLAWAEADSALLLDPALYEVNPEAAVERLKGARNLHGPRRAAAARLAAWRESEALRLDRPRQWILRDTVLIDIASRQPQNLDALAKIDDLPPKLVRRAGRDILEALERAAGDANDYVPPPRPDEEQKSLLKRMQHLVEECARDLGIAAETIASKKELSAVIIGGSRDSRVFGGWRGELIGDDLAALL